MLSIKPPRSTLSWLGLKLLSITLIALSLSACFEEAPQANPRAKDVTVSTATNFARALVSRDFTEAHALLSTQAQQRYSAAQLQQAYADMTSYGDGPGAVDGHVEFMDDWPARQSQDIGWAYVSITGAGFIEAVTVVVAEENGAAKIREIDGYDLRAEAGRQAFLEERCYIRFRITSSREEARSLERVLEAGGAFPFQGRVNPER